MKSKVVFSILGAIIIFGAGLVVYTNRYISEGMIDVERGQSITLNHSCFIYYQGGNIRPTAIERAVNKNSSTKRIRLYAPGEERVARDIHDISTRIQQGEFSAASVLGNDFSGREIDESAYTIDVANIDVSEVRNYKTKAGMGLFEELTIGKGYEANFDVVLTFRDHVSISKDFLKIAIKYPNVSVQANYLDRSAMNPMAGLSGNPLQNMLNKFQAMRTGTFKAKFLPLDTSKHAYFHQYFLTPKHYYKVRFNQPEQ